jgi:translation initiation factor IF-3
MTLKKRTPGAPPAPGAPTGGSGSQGAFSPRTTFTPGGAPRTGPSPNVQKRMERFSRVMPTRDPGVRMNENIRVPEIRVIDEEGQVGVMSPREAIEIARSRGLDLIEIVPNAVPPVCKIIDFGKWKYEQQKRDKTAKKSTHQQLLKEVRFHPSTDTHDFEFKLRHARGFLLEGHKVKATVQFKGREVAYKQFGEDLLRKFQAALADLAKLDQDLSMMGRMMSMTLSPLTKKKKEEPKEKKEAKEPKEPKEKKEKPEGEAAVKKPRKPSVRKKAPAGDAVVAENESVTDDAVAEIQDDPGPLESFEERGDENIEPIGSDSFESVQNVSVE